MYQCKKESSRNKTCFLKEYNTSETRTVYHRDGQNKLTKTKLYILDIGGGPSKIIYHYENSRLKEVRGSTNFTLYEYYNNSIAVSHYKIEIEDTSKRIPVAKYVYIYDNNGKLQRSVNFNPDPDNDSHWISSRYFTYEYSDDNKSVMKRHFMPDNQLYEAEGLIFDDKKRAMAYAELGPHLSEHNILERNFYYNNGSIIKIKYK